MTLNGAGVFGAHVIAFNTITGTLVGGFSLTTQGTFVISRLEPGVYVVRVEPLDDADVTVFSTRRRRVNVNFKPRLLRASGLGARRAAAASAIEIKVTAK